MVVPVKGEGGYRETGTNIIKEGTRASTKVSYPGQRLPTRRGTQDHHGGRRLLCPSTHTQAKYHQPHSSGGGGANLHTGRWTGHQEKGIWSEASQTVVKESSYGRKTYAQPLLEADRQPHRNGRRGGNSKKGDRIRERCPGGQGTRVNLGGGKRGVPEPSLTGNIAT